MKTVEFILYVSDQVRSTKFYGKLLDLTPTLNVPGMTEFHLSKTVKLGLMPESGISNIRDWGDPVGYIADLDGHIIAFAKTTINSKL